MASHTEPNSGRDGQRISRLLIANRGEIACRIARTAHAMGIDVVAIVATDDMQSPHTEVADNAFVVPSYLDGAAIIEVAKRAGAEAIHPGYGFLAENAEFAALVEDAGLLFVGPTADAIAKLGPKLEAGTIAAEAGIPTIPRFSPNEMPTEFPVMVKASAGGGGKGMAIVHNTAEWPNAIESAKRVAIAAFGSDELIVERYLEAGRHIEVQILADAHGNVVHLGERECSIQRRHQKVIEEAPAPNLEDAIRKEITSAAVELAKRVGYRSAGTVEMMVDADGSFFFLEVNTRLQVEHAVTEMTTGIDIVREQIRIAEGSPLSFGQADVKSLGVAIEARIYAEDPSVGDLPATGTIARLTLPCAQDGVRIDCGVRTGQTLGINYDPMLAKVIGHGSDRSTAQRRLLRALRGLELAGVETNKAALTTALQTEAFETGQLTTRFWPTHKALFEVPAANLEWAAVAAAIFDGLERREQHLPLRIAPGFRLGGNAVRREQLESLGGRPTSVEVSIRALDSNVNSGENENRLEVSATSDTGENAISGVVSAAINETGLTLWDDKGMRHRFAIVTADNRVFVSGSGADVGFSIAPRFSDSSSAASPNSCVAPMPGRVVAVHVCVGDHVEEGQPLLVLEAMKMEHVVVAPHTGEVTEVLATAGEQVDADSVLVAVAATDSSTQ